MITPDRTLHAYAQRLQAAIAQCQSIEVGERAIPTREDRPGTLVLCRGGIDEAGVSNSLFPGDERAARPLNLVNGGAISLYVRLRLAGKTGGCRVASSKITCMGLPPGNPNKMQSFRYDQPEGQPRGDGWEVQLNDNPEHPWRHLHINFDLPHPANELRMPLGPVCPILLLHTFNYWYCRTFSVA